MTTRNGDDEQSGEASADEIDLHSFADADIEEIDWISPALTSFAEQSPVQETGGQIPLRQERIRGFLALSLTAIFGVVLIAPFILIIIPGTTWVDTREWLQTALPAITGLLGAVMGFYFGQRNN